MCDGRLGYCSHLCQEYPLNYATWANPVITNVPHSAHSGSCQYACPNPPSKACPLLAWLVCCRRLP